MRGPAPSQEKRQLLSVDVVGEASSAVPAPGAPDPHATIPLVGPFAGHLHFDASITPVLRTDVDVDAYVRRGTSRLGVDTALLASERPLPEDLRLALGRSPGLGPSRSPSPGPLLRSTSPTAKSRP